MKKIIYSIIASFICIFLVSCDFTGEPVITTHTTVIAETPPISSDRPMAMAVVIDFGSTEAVNPGSKANTIDNPTIVIIQATHPAVPHRSVRAHTPSISIPVR